MNVPALPNQEGMYLLSQVPELAATYNLFHILKIRGPLDRAALARAWQQIIDHHEALRSSFAFGASGLLQEVHDTVEATLEVVDLRRLPRAAQDERVRALARAEARRPFVLPRAPLLRLTLVTLAAAESLLFVCFHHLVVDGWSFVILLRELVRRYAALRAGAPLPLQPAAPSLVRVMAALHAELQDEAMAVHRDYWRRKLRGAPGTMEIAPDRQSAAGGDREAMQVTTAWPARLSEDVRDFSRHNGCSPFATLLAATRVLLCRYGADPEGLIHVPFANRRRHAKVCGCLMNTLPLGGAWRPAGAFAGLLQEVHRDLREASAHQAYPGTWIDRDRGAAIRDGPARVSGSVVELAPITPESVGTLVAGDCTVEVVATDFAAAPFALALSFARAPGPLQLTLTFRTDLYTERFAHQIGAHYEVLVRRLMDRPDAPLSTISPVDRGTACVAGAPRLGRGGPGALHEAFEAQARRTPQGVAILATGTRLTYRALDQRADRLCARLLRAGVLPGDTVGIRATPRAQTIAGILAILKSGAAFVPLGAGEPGRRRLALARQAGCRFLLDGARLEAFGQRRGPPEPGGLAYVLFTSGTTGLPKGVLIEHRSIVAQLAALRSLPPVRRAARFLLLSPLIFDASLEQVFLPLTGGGTLFIPAQEVTGDPVRLWRYVRRHRIDVIDTVPSLMQVLLDAAPAATVPLVILGAEPLTGHLIRQVFTRLRPRTVLNTYGPTETTINATVHDCRDFVPALGRPLPGYEAHVLDADLHPVPDGVVGELYIGGVGVARGYVNDRALTAQRFIEHPAAPGGRLYASGDLVRRGEGGVLTFVGRRDDQLKLYGVRIEPGEIVAQLLSCTGVRQAAVRIVEQGPEGRGRKLVACLQAGPGYDEDRVRKELRQRLPGHLVPGALVAVDSLPALPSGKCDWSKVPLPAPATGPRVAVAPPGEREQEVARVFQEALKRRGTVGPEDDFFALGGGSLSAMDAVFIAERRGLALRLTDIYEKKTPRKIAAALARPASGPAAADPVDAARRLPPRGAPVRRRPRRLGRVLLTGATGFLGAHLARELLEETAAGLCCLVRGRDEGAARERLRRVWRYYFGPRRAEALCRRARVLAGDVTEERLGLPVARWDALRRELDGVVHTAALVSYFDRPERLGAVNIDGTQRVVDLCVAGGAWLAHASTLGVESADLAQVPYVRSKQEAEARVVAAAGLDASILRVGLLTGRSTDGWFQPNLEANAFYRILRAALTEALPPPAAPVLFHLTPVDQCCRAARLLIERSRRLRAVHHLRPARAVTLGELVTLAGRSRTDAAPPAGWPAPGEEDLLLQATFEELARHGFRWSPVDGRYLKRLLAYMRRSGFLPPDDRAP